MFYGEKREMLAVRLGDIDEAKNLVLLDAYLADAKTAILNRAYPFGWTEEDEVPTQYDTLQVKLAERYILRRGAEGEKAHNENGISRTYGSVNDEDLLSEVMQVIR